MDLLSALLSRYALAVRLVPGDELCDIVTRLVPGDELRVIAPRRVPGDDNTMALDWSSFSSEMLLSELMRLIVRPPARLLLRLLDPPHDSVEALPRHESFSVSRS
mmetsp:Transcript_28217/g.46784  ORF Transcript_28217/g.46784 Transcript_28217/m.46784 type:complete len:105 (+) Transcript_28217:555-869(+)